MSNSLAIIGEDEVADTSKAGGSTHIGAILRSLSERIQGEVRLDTLYQRLYAQDASPYREQPLGVVFPKSKEDLVAVVKCANEHSIPLIPRGGGTSLAGQVVGAGLVIDTSRFMNSILHIDIEAKLVRVQPGVVREDLNRELAKFGLQFAPETSTSNRCTIGGMIANNSCGTNSIRYGNTRDHLKEVELLFADGTLEQCGEWDEGTRVRHSARSDLLGSTLRAIDSIVGDNAEVIRTGYPRAGVTRRNSGYPLDILLAHQPFAADGEPFSLARLVCGSEGTLGFITEATLKVVPIAKHRLLIAAHFARLDESLRATLLAVKHKPAAVEIIDKRTLDLAKLNVEQEKNRFFVQGDPAVIVAISCEGDDMDLVRREVKAIVDELSASGMGYAYPLIEAPKDKAVWELRKEGLGIVMGQPGDTKPETLIEDAAVAVEDLPEYVQGVVDILARYETPVMMYGHLSVGLVHFRPELNLKDPLHKEKYLRILDEVTALVKKFKGSISGEHGDGRVRSPYLREVLGDEVMELHHQLKLACDPNGIFNKGMIVDPKPVDADWRAYTGRPTPEVPTVFNWDAKMGLVRAVEKCNGVGACRKSAGSGGTMCPSYMVTLDEKDSTRGRANMFQQLFIDNVDPREAMVSKDLYDALDLCLSCKGCKRECPSSIDMARMKAEFMQAYHDRHGTPLGSYLFGYYELMCKLGALTPRIANFFMTFGLTKKMISAVMKVSLNRSLPLFAPRTFRQWFRSRGVPTTTTAERVFLYVDPFTNYTEPAVGEALVSILEKGGFVVSLLPVEDDGRTLLSKGLVRAAKRLAEKNLRRIQAALKDHPDAMIVGIEPSSLLTFRDEMPDLVDRAYREEALSIASRSLLIEEFIVRFSERYQPLWSNPESSAEVVLHGHCHQKALVGTAATESALRGAGYKVRTLATGCCGMAGSFGYEEKHYDLSMKVGELVLFPALRKESSSTKVCAPGTSCRHQIHDGVGRAAHHPAILLAQALGAA